MVEYDHVDPETNGVTVEEQSFDGKKSFKVVSDAGLELILLAHGATMLSCKYKDRNGDKKEITLNRQTFADLNNPDKNPKYGVTCGRVAGRIGGAKFTIDGTEYPLEANNGDACLHGGSMGFDRYEWQAEIIREARLASLFNHPLASDDDDKYTGVKFSR